VGSSLQTKGLRFDVKVWRAERQAKPPAWLVWSISESTCICAQSSREVPPSSTSNRIPGGQPNRVHRRRNCAEENHFTVYIELLWGLCMEAGSGIKSMRYRTTRTRDPREWAEIGAVMSATRRLFCQAWPTNATPECHPAST